MRCDMYSACLKNESRERGTIKDQAAREEEKAESDEKEIGRKGARRPVGWRAPASSRKAKYGARSSLPQSP